MDIEGQIELKETLIRANLEYDIEPELKVGEDVPFFDIVSETGPIQPSTVLNVLHAAIQEKNLTVDPKLISAQKYCLTFEDLN